MDSPAWTALSSYVYKSGNWLALVHTRPERNSTTQFTMVILWIYRVLRESDKKCGCPFSLTLMYFMRIVEEIHYSLLKEHDVLRLNNPFVAAHRPRWKNLELPVDMVRCRNFR